MPWTSDQVSVWLRVPLLRDFHLGMPDLTCFFPDFIKTITHPHYRQREKLKWTKEERKGTSKEEEDWRFLVVYKQKERLLVESSPALLCKRLLRAHSTPGSIPDMVFDLVQRCLYEMELWNININQRRNNRTSPKVSTFEEPT